MACTDRRTLYHLDPHRGQAAMDTAGVLPEFTGVAVHDGWAAYYTFDKKERLLKIRFTTPEEQMQNPWSKLRSG